MAATGESPKMTTFSTSRFNSSGTNSGSLASAFSKLSSFTSGAGIRRPLSGIGIGSSLYGVSTAEEKIVLDVGSYTLRAGFSGDMAPLHSQELFSEFSFSGNRRLIATNHGLFDYPIEDESVIELLLMEQLRNLYREQLLVDSKSRKVVIVENPLLPLPAKRALLRVLLGNLRVPQVTLLPNSICGLMTCGKTSGIVVDIGYHSTTIVPVYDARPMNSYLVSTPLAGSALFNNVKSLLKLHATFKPFNKTENYDMDEILSDALLLHIMNKLIYASPVAISNKLLDGKSLNAEFLDEELVEWFKQSITSANDFVTLTTKLGILQIPNWIRERSVEILLHGDQTIDQKGIVQSIFECLSKAPIDIRKELASNILVVGGLADIPNLRIRILHDLIAHLRNPQSNGLHALVNFVALAEEPHQEGEWKGNGLVFKSSERPWIGASLAIAAKIGGLDIKRDDFDECNLTDWTTN